MRKYVDGLSCHYLDEGEGQPVLLLHGFTSDTFTWRPVVPLLASRFRVIAVDLPGHGLSDKPPGFDYTIPGFAAWVLAFMDALGIARPAIIGNSMGGGIAHTLAATRPDRVRAVVLEDAVGYQPARERFWVFRLWSIRPLGEIAMALLTPFVVRSLMRTYLYLDPGRLTDAFARRYVATLRTKDGRAAALRTIREADFNAAGGLPILHVPALVIWGAQDRIVPPAHAEIFARGIPGAKLHVFQACGHLPHEEKAETWSRLVSEFLGNHV